MIAFYQYDIFPYPLNCPAGVYFNEYVFLQKNERNISYEQITFLSDNYKNQIDVQG